MVAVAITQAMLTDLLKEVSWYERQTVIKCPIIFINPSDTQKYRFHGSLCCLLILHQGADSQKCSSAERCCLIEKSLHMHYFLTLLGDKVATPGLVIIDVSVRMCKTYFCV